MATNFAIFGLGFVAFFVVGYGLMFGGYSFVLAGFDFGYDHAVGSNLVGSGEWVFLWNPLKLVALNGLLGEDMVADSAFVGAVMGFVLYMVAFMDTTATIPTGSMAERWKWKSFVWWGIFCGARYYPVFGGWTWGGGWMSQLGNSLGLGNGYVDFAGSGIVHATGGVAALAGAMVLGPRLGKFGPDGRPRALFGHNIPMAMLGTFILLFGWFGFNAASTLAASDTQFAVVATNTAIAGALGATAGMVWIARRAGKPDPAMMANGMLAGLVAITAPCTFVDPWAAAVIGGVAGLLCGGTGQFVAQLVGVAVICTVMLGLAYAFFRIQDALTEGGIRSSEEDELAGLDIPEMGVPAYHDVIGGGDPIVEVGAPPRGAGSVVSPGSRTPVQVS